jgi:hypothetical protein
MRDIQKKYDVGAPAPPGAPTTLSAEEHMSVVKAEQQSLIVGGQQDVGYTVSILSITPDVGTATVTTATPHGLSSNMWADISGVDQWQYSGVQQVTVLSDLQFTFDIPIDKSVAYYAQMAGTYIQDNTVPFNDDYNMLRVDGSNMPTPDGYYDGMVIIAIMRYDNTTLTPTISLCGLPAVDIILPPYTEMHPSTIAANMVYKLLYFNNNFILYPYVINGDDNNIYGLKGFYDGLTIGDPAGYTITTIAYGPSGDIPANHNLVTQDFVDNYFDPLPAGTIMWFYANVAPPGWTTSPLRDLVIAIKGGSDGYNTTGGNIGGTWDQPDMTLTIDQMPSHLHEMSSGNPAGPSSQDGWLLGDNQQKLADIIDPWKMVPAGGDQPHNHGDTWRPEAAIGVLGERDTV